MSVVLANAEELHRLLFEAHRFASEAGSRLHDAIVKLHAAGRHSDTRSELQPIITLLESARNDVDKGLLVAGDARTGLIRLTGCSGACSKAPEEAQK